MRKLFSPAVIVLSFIASAIAAGELPATVTVDWSKFLPLHLAASTTSVEPMTLFVLPAVAVMVALLFYMLKSSIGEKIARGLYGNRVSDNALSSSALLRFEATYDIIANLVVTLVIAFHVVFLMLVFGDSNWATRGLVIGVGAIMILIGNLMPRLRPNAVMGLRTVRTLEDPRLWSRTHRLFGALLVIVGFGTVAMSFIAVRYALATTLIGLVIACAIVSLFLRKDGSLRWSAPGP